jgi:phosphoglycolate phosphatase
MSRSVPFSPVEAIFFDLDGTLLDTLADLGGAMNGVLSVHGFPTHPISSYANFIGEGMERLVEQASGGAGPQETLMTELLVDYQKRMIRETRPYPGVREVLGALRKAEIPMGVLSNKAHGMTVAVVERIFSETPFGVVRGHVPPTPKKPSPILLQEAAEVLGVRPQNCLFVGDTKVDMRAASGANMNPIGVAWGYQSTQTLRNAGALHILEQMSELLEFVP